METSCRRLKGVEIPLKLRGFAASRETNPMTFPEFCPGRHDFKVASVMGIS
jgi:hypothetical protein